MNLLSSLEATTPARLLPPCAESVLALAELARHQSRQPLAPLLRRDPGLWAAALASRAESAPDRAPPDRAPPDRAAPDRAPPDRAAPDRAAPDRAPPDRAPPAEHTGCDDGDVALAQRLLGDILARPRLGFADWTSSAARLAWQAANLGADAARRLAQRLDLSAAGLETLGCFLFLGHLVQAQEGDPSLHALEPFQLMRLLARRWSWPHWLREPLTAFDPRLPPPRAAAVGRPLACLHLAQALVARALPELELGPGADVPRLLESLGLPPGALAELGAAPAVLPTPPLALPAPAAELFCRALRCAEPPAAAGSADVLLRLEQELETAQARLGDLQADVEGRLRDRKLEALAEFAAGAAHEINNPLAVISAQAQHLLKSEESLERARALERIILQARRIHQVLRDLMLYARPPRPKLTTLRLDALLAAALRQVAEPAEARDIELQKAERFAGVKLRGDAQLLTSALVCLLKNAVAAAPAGGRVTLSRAGAPRGQVGLCIEDNGPGLPAGIAHQVFDPFYSGKAAGRGMGLGLPKAWRIAQLHGGRLAFESQPGGPTRFYLTLPIKARPARRPAAAPVLASAARHTRPRETRPRETRPRETRSRQTRPRHTRGSLGPRRRLAARRRR